MESDPLGHIPLFAPLSNEERAELSGLLKPKRFSPGEHIVWVGEPGVEFFIIQQGRVAITLPDENGRELVLATLTAGQVFGESSLLDGGPRTATARAETEAELLELGRNEFLEVVRKHPSAALHMVKVLAQRQREADDTVP